MGKESFIKSGLKVASFMFVMAVVFVLSRNTAGMAAGKKVRVNTYDELVAAVDNSSVETILLNTKIIGTYKIQEMKNAKNKNLIINAPDIDIVNKAVWKSVEIEYVNWERNGKGKEYQLGKLGFEGEDLNGKRNGKRKEYYSDNKLKFEGEYLKNMEWKRLL